MSDGLKVRQHESLQETAGKEGAKEWAQKLYKKETASRTTVLCQGLLKEKSADLRREEKKSVRRERIEGVKNSQGSDGLHVSSSRQYLVKVRSKRW